MSRALVDSDLKASTLRLYGLPYRLGIWWLRYVRARDLLQVIMAAATGVLAINTFSVSPTTTLLAGGVYFISLAFLTYGNFSSRRARDYVQGEVIWGLFAHMNKEVFDDSSTNRFTLFLQSPLAPTYIVPWYRYHKGARDPIREAERSRARYRRGESFTGQAWADSGRSLSFASLPPFGTRAEFETYYIDTLKISGDAVRDLSHHMEKVQTIFSYGFCDSRGKFLGVFSLDLQAPVRRLLDGSIQLDGDDINAQEMALIVRSIGNVLESFSLIPGR